VQCSTRTVAPLRGRFAKIGGMTLRELNRATLARQMLLSRQKHPVVKAIEQLVALQAQLPRPPFAGLWSRLDSFSRADLSKAVHARTVVRATTMRGTIHLMSAADYLRFRGCLQASLDAALVAVLRDRATSLNLTAICKEALAFFSQPHNFEEARVHLVKAFPAGDERAMGYAVRLNVPLVQVPSDDVWAYPAQADFVSAAAWLKKPVAPASAAGIAALLVRYLAAYGPATIKDAQAWTGVAGLEAAAASLKDKLITVPGPTGKPLYDLPDAPRPDADTPAPVRFLPEWDSVIVTRADERIVAKADRPRVFLPGLRVAALVLVDGMAAGTWKVAATAKKASLQIESFASWTAARKRDVTAEGEALVRFVEPNAKAYDVTVSAA